MKSIDSPGIARRLFTQALEVVRAGGDADERVHAACAARMLAYLDLAPDERLLTDLMGVTAVRLTEPEIVDVLVSILRHLTRGDANLAAGLERLAIRAEREGLKDSLRALVIHMLAFPAWAARVHGEWSSVVLRFDSTESFRASQRVLWQWVGEHGTLLPWMREALELHPELLSTWLPHSIRWLLHRAAPTARGWRTLAGWPTHGDEIVSAARFGKELDAAIQTLEAALTEERNEVRRVVLARWLSEVSG